MSKKVLIIEDDQDILDIMAYILSDEGYDVVTGNDGSLLKDVQAMQPSIILMDNQLRDSLGKNHCMSLKTNPETNHFPVVLISANVNLENMAADNLADAYLKKPFDIKELVDIVEKFALN